MKQTETGKLSLLKRRKLFLILLFVIILLLGFAAQRILFAQEKTSYITARVAKADIEEKVLASGTLTAFKTVAVGAQVSGQLKKLYVKLGDRVAKGQLLGEIDPVLQKNSLRDAEATLQNTQAQRRAKAALLRQYEQAFQRQQQLIASGVTARSDLEVAQAQYDSTRAELAALDAQINKARISVDTAKANLEYTRIVAPMDGVVIAIVTEEGQTVVSAQAAPTILKLADLSIITVKAQISEADVMRVKPGLTAYFTVLGDADKRYYSKLRAIEPGPDSINSTTTSTTANSTAIYYNGLFDVPNPDNTLRVSMTAQVSIVLGTAKQVLCIPCSVLGTKLADGQYRVKVLEKGQSVERQIRTGMTDNVQIQVLEGLREGEDVIVGDSTTLPATQNSNSGHPPPRRN